MYFGKDMESIAIRDMRVSKIVKKLKSSVIPLRKCTKYTSQQISKAFMIRSVSLKAYEVLRSSNLTLNPLPYVRTLQRKISHFLCIQETLFLCCRSKSRQMHLFSTKVPFYLMKCSWRRFVISVQG